MSAKPNQPIHSERPIESDEVFNNGPSPLAFRLGGASLGAIVAVAYTENPNLEGINFSNMDLTTKVGIAGLIVGGLAGHITSRFVNRP